MNLETTIKAKSIGDYFEELLESIAIQLYPESEFARKNK